MTTTKINAGIADVLKSAITNITEFDFLPSDRLIFISMAERYVSGKQIGDLHKVLEVLRKSQLPKAKDLLLILEQQDNSGDSSSGAQQKNDSAFSGSIPAGLAKNEEFASRAINSMKSFFIEALPIDQIVLVPGISDIFSKSEDMINSLSESIRQNGFEPNKGITVALHEGKYKLLDGHHRREAAIRAELTNIPAMVIPMKSIEEMELKSITEQTMRRNMTDMDYLRIIRVLLNYEREKAKDRQGRSQTLLSRDNNVPGRSNEFIGRCLGFSPAKVARWKKVAEHATEDMLAKISDGSQSVNQAYNLISENERANEEKDNQLAAEEAASVSEAPKTSACLASTAASEITAAAEKKNKKEVSAEVQPEPDVNKKDMDAQSVSDKQEVGMGKRISPNNNSGDDEKVLVSRKVLNEMFDFILLSFWDIKELDDIVKGDKMLEYVMNECDKKSIPPK